jgi:EmrB/QacA subfamily drug resistance transporter
MQNQVPPAAQAPHTGALAARQTARTTSTPPAASSNYKWQVLFTVIFGFFMMLLDTTVINVAFTTLQAEFGGSLGQAQWIISVYVLAIGITTPLSGFLANRFTSKSVYIAGLGLFAFGSLLCGLSTSLYMLVAFRALQGVGAGLTMPLGVSLLLQAFPVKEHGMALGYHGLAAVVAPALGPILGGWLVSLNLWRVIFFINPPIGLAGVIMGWYFLRSHKGGQRPPFDWGGIITEIIAFGAILYAASMAADEGWTAPSTLLWFGIGAAGLAAFVIVELWVAKVPLLDLRLYRNRIFLNASLLSYVAILALFGAEFLLPIYLQALRGRSALETGLILLPMALSSGILLMLSGRIYDRIGPRPLVVLGFAILSVNTWQLSQVQAGTSMQWIMFLLFLRGLALGLTAQTTMVAALSQVPMHDLPRGSSLNNAARNVVQALGVALLATVLASTLSPAVKALQNQIATPATSAVQNAGLCPAPGTSSGQNSTSVTQPDAEAGLVQRACDENIAGFERTYRLTFYASLLATLLGAFLPGWPLRWGGRQMMGAPVVSH